MKNDPRSYDRNFYNCVKKPEKKIQDINGAWTERRTGIARSRVQAPLKSWTKTNSFSSFQRLQNHFYI